jgi:hypothetical protein
MSEPFPSPAEQGNPALQRLILRVAAVMAWLVIPAVLAPRLVIEKLSWFLGYGQPSKTPLIYYLGAGGSLVYLALSALLWKLSEDVVRYRPLVVFAAWAFLLCGPLYLWIDLQAGMPLWWVSMDSVACVLAGAWLLWACHVPPRARPAPASPLP